MFVSRDNEMTVKCFFAASVFLVFSLFLLLFIRLFICVCLITVTWCLVFRGVPSLDDTIPIKINHITRYIFITRDILQAKNIAYDIYKDNTQQAKRI